jgi:hypothetical protein
MHEAVPPIRRNPTMSSRMFTLIACAALVFYVVADEAPAPAEQGSLIVIDAAGKEQKLKSWKFAAGVRRLSWLAKPPPAAPNGDSGKTPKSRARTAPAGPEALEFREENSTTFVEGVLTFVPLARLRSLEYDAEQKIVTAHIAANKRPEDDILLTGTTRFERVNKLAIEAEVDKGALGIADVRFLSGTQKGIRGVRFPGPVPDTERAGRPALITTGGKEQSTHRVSDLQALYRFSNGYERLVPLLMFKKTLKLDIAKIAKISASAGEEDDGGWQVQLKDGGDETLSLLRVIPLDGQDTQLEGLLGRVPAGYKLFPVLTISEIVFDPGVETDKKPAPKPAEKPEPKSDPKPEKQ